MKKLISIIMILSIILPIKTYAKDTISDEVKLNSCVDADSARFMLGVGEIKVRFLGIDASEKIVDDETDEINESLISDYVCEALTQAKKIKIEYDPKAPREDKYGRLQVWVYVDDILLQEDLVKLGYAKMMYLEDDYLYANELKSAQRSAREKGLGIWKNKPNEKEPEEEIQEEEEEKSKSFIQVIIDFFADIFNGIISFIDDLINNIF